MTEAWRTEQPTVAELRSVVSVNTYKGRRTLVSRCIDGRYANDPRLPALTLPGADPGEIAILFAAARNYGFAVNPERAFESLSQAVGREKNLRYHQVCGHLKNITDSPSVYGLRADEVEWILTRFDKSRRRGGAALTKLHGTHYEGAIILTVGDYGVYPRYMRNGLAGQLFVVQQTLADRRRRQFIRALHRNNAVELPEQWDGLRFYRALDKTAEDHLMASAKILAPGLPIYEAAMRSDGTIFHFRDRGKV